MQQVGRAYLRPRDASALPACAHHRRRADCPALSRFSVHRLRSPKLAPRGDSCFAGVRERMLVVHVRDTQRGPNSSTNMWLIVAVRCATGMRQVAGCTLAGVDI